MITKSDLQTNEINIKDPRQIFSKEFKSEKHLTNYIVENIEKFCSDVLDDYYISFEKEYVVCQTPKPWGCNARQDRVDLYIKCVSYNYIIELKNPKYQCENRYAVGQLLDYGRRLFDTKKKLILLSTRFDIETARTIEFYNLPIRYIYFEKSRMLEFKRDA